MFRPISQLSLMRLVFAWLMSSAVFATTYGIGDVRFEDSATVFGQKLILNGAAASNILSAKSTVVALYLSKKQNTQEGVANLAGAKRISLIALREISSKDLGNVLMDRIRQNATQDEINSNVLQIVQIGGIFGTVPRLKKDDVVHIDWNPAKKQTEFRLNDKLLGEQIQGESFFGMFTKVWLGPKVREKTRAGLLGQGDPLEVVAP
ncbi:Chalcone isomerase-like [Chitinimonas taiwanensis DSM 18899]|uniref:Chalcone isomerase-like n=2 Tax=Chitinimonas TaxID=240411 RepID=A0A1K2HT69_9NEIS|nr:Chalcone isomerase-like [Chitinimonas taiwanensis DSM 18899]